MAKCDTEGRPLALARRMVLQLSNIYGMIALQAEQIRRLKKEGKSYDSQIESFRLLLTAKDPGAPLSSLSWVSPACCICCCMLAVHVHVDLASRVVVHKGVLAARDDVRKASASRSKRKPPVPTRYAASAAFHDPVVMRYMPEPDSPGDEPAQTALSVVGYNFPCPCRRANAESDVPMHTIIPRAESPELSPGGGGGGGGGGGSASRPSSLVNFDLRAHRKVGTSTGTVLLCLVTPACGALSCVSACLQTSSCCPCPRAHYPSAKVACHRRHHQTAMQVVRLPDVLQEFPRPWD